MAANPYAGIRSGTYLIQAQERVSFGKPIAQALPLELDALGARRVFVTSSRSLTSLSDGPLQWVERALGTRHVGTFGTIRAHSPREDVIAGAQAARAAGADLLLAVGGGSVIDATKAMLLCLWHALDDVDVMEPYRFGTDPKLAKPIVVPGNPVRMAAVPTTLSAAEFNWTAGVTESRLKAKQSFRHRLFVPRAVILDPAATFNTPDWLLYSSGIRAVDHAAESYCSPVANPATEILSLHGLGLLARSLPAIRADPAALAPRHEAQLGMWQSIAASVAGAGTGASHGIGYVLGSGYGVNHGHTSCVMLPAVLRWNAAVNGDRQQALSEAMGAPNRPAADLVAELVAALGQPGNLRAVNIPREELDRISVRALDYPNVLVNPRPIRNAAEVREILELAW